MHLNTAQQLIQTFQPDAFGTPSILGLLAEPDPHARHQKRPKGKQHPLLGELGIRNRGFVGGFRTRHPRTDHRKRRYYVGSAAQAIMLSARLQEAGFKTYEFEVRIDNADEREKLKDPKIKEFFKAIAKGGRSVKSALAD